MKKLLLGIAVCCAVSGVNGMELIYDDETMPNEGTCSLSTNCMSESYDSLDGVIANTSSSGDETSEEYGVTTGLQWIKNHKDLIDLAQTDGSAFDKLIDILTEEKMVSLYDYISSKCWGCVGRFGASHDDTAFYATYECQQYMD